MITIIPVLPDQPTYRTGCLKDITKASIEAVLGFPPNVLDDPDKVTASWTFTVDGVFCAIWDYRGSFHHRQASTYGPHQTLAKLFKGRYTPERIA